MSLKQESNPSEYLHGNNAEVLFCYFVVVLDHVIEF
jgi:hypothetical protein